jgi:hypothetical protein
MTNERRPPLEAEGGNATKLMTDKIIPYKPSESKHPWQPDDDEEEDLHKQIESFYSASLSQLRAQVAALKKYLQKKGVSAEASRELDEFVMDVQDRWGVALESIEGLLDEK